MICAYFVGGGVTGMSPQQAILPSPQSALNHLPWHGLSPGEVATHLAVDPDAGLTTEESVRRIAQYGLNEIHERPPHPLWRMLLDQFPTS